MRQVKYGAIVLALVGSAAMAQAQRGGQERQSDERGSTVREWAPNAQRGGVDTDRRAQFMQRRAEIMERVRERRAGQADSRRDDLREGEARRGAQAGPQGERFGGSRSPDQEGNARGRVGPGARGERGVPRQRGALRPQIERGNDGAGPVPEQRGEFRGRRGGQRGEQVQRPQGERFQGQRFQGQRDGQRPQGQRLEDRRMNNGGPEQRFGGGDVERPGRRGLRAGPGVGERRGPGAGAQEGRRSAPVDGDGAFKRRVENGSDGRL